MKFNQAAFDMLKPMPPFKAELRQANRENKKTRTRRVMSPQPNGCYASLDAYRLDLNVLGEWIYWDDVWNYRNAYARLWDDINAKRGFGWNSNPNVWVIGYHDEFAKDVAYAI